MSAETSKCFCRNLNEKKNNFPIKQRVIGKMAVLSPGSFVSTSQTLPCWFGFSTGCCGSFHFFSRYFQQYRCLAPKLRNLYPRNFFSYIFFVYKSNSDVFPVISIARLMKKLCKVECVFQPEVFRNHISNCYPAWFYQEIHGHMR